VRFLPGVSNEVLSALLQSASVLLAPSLYEGFGWPVIEAQSFGVPVICADRGALPEISGGAALYADAEDHAMLASHLDSVLRDRDLAADLQRRGSENVKRFGFAEWQRRHLRLYDDLLSGAGLL
jgi:glycosyltransferase involved in cell wall biosynthesis